MKKKYSLKIWHQRTGIFAAVFVLILSISGILLNHTHELGLAQRHINSDFLLSVYGMKPSNDSTCFQTTALPVCQLGQKHFIGTQPINDVDGDLLGTYFTQGMYILLYEKFLCLFTEDIQLIEKIPLPQPASQLATANDEQIAIKAKSQWLLSDLSFFAWQSGTPGSSIKPITPGRVDAEHIRQLQEKNTEQLLSMERLLLDLHSGRIFGSWGVYLMDLCALALMLLAGSGVYRWSQKFRR